MTGQELYELSVEGYKHIPWDNLPEDLKEYYDRAAHNRRRNDYQEQGESIHSREQTCSGGCAGCSCE